MKLAIVGATGLVGQMLLHVIEDHQFKVDELLPVASTRSLGKVVQLYGNSYKIISAEEAIAQKPDLAIFSAGGAVSLELAPRFAMAGITVIDNSSTWRNDPSVPLVVPEINAASIQKSQRIIANPNCSTIQMVVALAPLHRKYGIKRLVISTYQSVSGSGAKGLHQLELEQLGQHSMNPAYPHQIHLNLIPHGGAFLENGYTTEEQKLVSETRKILNDPQIAITSTVVRVPVTGGHSMAVNIELKNKFDLIGLRQLLENAPGIVVQDDPSQNFYPMPLFAHYKDAVFVGRIRRDESAKNALNLWIVSDNLRKGAATNAVQIASWLKENNYLD